MAEPTTEFFGTERFALRRRLGAGGMGVVHEAHDRRMDKIVALCKRRGFIFPSSEIYGGLGSTYDYGHYGVLLKNNVKAQWWRAMLQ